MRIATRHVAAVVAVADGARVDAARVRIRAAPEPGRAALRGAGHGTAWAQRAQYGSRRARGLRPDRGDQVLEAGMPLDGEEFAHAHAAGAGLLSDDHRPLGPLLGIAGQGAPRTLRAGRVPAHPPYRRHSSSGDDERTQRSRRRAA